MDQEHKNQLGYFGRVSGRDKNLYCKMKLELRN